MLAEIGVSIAMLIAGTGDTQPSMETRLFDYHYNVGRYYQAGYTCDWGGKMRSKLETSKQNGAFNEDEFAIVIQAQQDFITEINLLGVGTKEAWTLCSDTYTKWTVESFEGTLFRPEPKIKDKTPPAPEGVEL